MYEPLEKINSYQREAVVNEDKFLLLNASVGSGKTTVLVHKILYLYHVKKVPLNSMVVLTFTNKAAEEIKTRIMASDPSITNSQLSLFGTFHSVARQLLRTVLPVEDIGYSRDFSVIDPHSVIELFESIINRYSFDVKYKKSIEKRIKAFKDGRILFGNMKQEDDLEEFINIYDREKGKKDLMDFDDLINIAGRLLKHGGFKPSWVIIDEFQDTDESQLNMIKSLIGGNTSLFAVGDPNQTIYSWRGGNTNVFEDFRRQYNASVKSLPVNYRSSGVIIEAAKRFAGNPENLEAIREKGHPIVIKRHYNSFNEALYLASVIRKLSDEGTPYKDIGIFYRMQKQSTVLEEVFGAESIPFEVSVKRTLKDIPVLYWFVRLCKASLNNRDTDSFVYVIKDSRYGLNLSKREASKLIKEMEGSDGRYSHDIILKIRGFREWCSGIENIQDLDEQIYSYFDIDNYISPTSIYYDKDKEIIMKALRDIKQHIDSNKFGIAEGVKSIIDNLLIYGPGVNSDKKDAEKDTVKLMTLHASKGLEFKHVFISGANYGIIPMAGRLDDEEEKRLFFVGITRAKDYLEISYHSNPEDYRALPDPSPYIRMIPDELIESEELKSRSLKLSELRKEIKNNIDNKLVEEASKKRVVNHPKYGEGYLVSETEDSYAVNFEGYGEKSFSKLFNPL